MKFLFALLALAPLAASAATEVRCRDVHAGPDHGYYAVIKRLTTAEITSQSIAGPRPVQNGSLRCVVPHTVRIPGRPHVVAICTTPQMNDGGLMLTLREERNGLVANLSQQTRSGPRAITQMVCGHGRE